MQESALYTAKINQQDAEKYSSVFVEITTSNHKKLTFATVFTDSNNNRLLMMQPYTMRYITQCKAKRNNNREPQLC